MTSQTLQRTGIGQQVKISPLQQRTPRQVTQIDIGRYGANCGNPLTGRLRQSGYLMHAQTYCIAIQPAVPGTGAHIHRQNADTMPACILCQL
jgi:hypothetical protein